jgi:hypothetical protein
MPFGPIYPVHAEFWPHKDSDSAVVLEIIDNGDSVMEIVLSDDDLATMLDDLKHRLPKRRWSRVVP